MNHDNRLHRRSGLAANVILRHPGFGELNLKAHDISDGGISVKLGNHIAPPVGTLVDVIIKSHTGPINAEPVKMEVRHASHGIIGLKFLK
ncbi:Uncharacterised protein [BD1-7 clade bacterium]|uniref:PilZ domain-containing protein n=1 Tax=BD1-7 clade bacterium TaxID=2029982 RepID=A0A5S9QJ74_9GAMM|nr:Uncharacterised protein [BD1-7 clade bacterium]CAA0117771.1 Uncharacterised protein [BD1-7 clade bacterium]CAA0125355.1 Uncharacterised protein [BD1-7 clade bacterium]